MATDSFIPEIWSKKLLKTLDNTSVMVDLVNRDYEGEITQAGDIVHVRTFGSVTVNNYTRNSTISFQALTDPMVDLLIDQQKYFAFKVDDLDKAQANVDILEGYVQRAATAMRDVVDSRLLSHYVQVHTDNIIGTDMAPITLTAANIYGYIIDLAERLDKKNVAMDGRHLVITPQFKTLLLKAPEFTRATGLGDSTITNGRIGTIGGFNVHVTTNMAAVSGVLNLMAFGPDFITYASQVAKLEHVRPTDQFCDAVKGLYLYGSKVLHPEAGAVLKANAS